MKRESLWQISVTASRDTEETASALLEESFLQPPVVYVDAETNSSVVSVYCDKPKAWVLARRSGLKAVRSAAFTPLRWAHFKVSVKKLRRRDWAESWKRHFPPIEIGTVLLIKPSWSKRRPKKGQAVIVLDPGLSFGTGQHATTAFCLEQLVGRRQAGVAQSFLDIGTGSGILAIAAAKIGYAPVHAFDFDPDAVRTARANVHRNRVSNKMQIASRDLTTLPLRGGRKYHVVCANLVSNLLLNERARVLNRLQDDGALVLAGILQSEFPEIQRAYEGSGLRLAASRAEKEWRSGTFLRRH